MHPQGHPLRRSLCSWAADQVGRFRAAPVITHQGCYQHVEPIRLEPHNRLRTVWMRDVGAPGWLD